MVSHRKGFPDSKGSNIVSFFVPVAKA